MSAALPVQMLDDEQPMARDALEIATDALDEIALAGMSGSGNESEEGMREWHARRAWEFISIAARAKTAIREALAAPVAPVPEPTERVAVSVAAHINQELLAALQAVVEFDTYETEYAGSMVTLCPDCGVQDGGEHSASCAFSKAVKLIELALATPPQQATPAESMLTPHTCAGFDAAFRSEHQRPPTAQEVWGAAIKSWRDLNTPAASTIAAAQPDERAAFEAWAATEWANAHAPHVAWLGWQGRAALATQAAPVEPCSTCGGTRIDPGGLPMCRDCYPAPVDTKPAESDHIHALLAEHQKLIDAGNDYAYFELARTRATDWMAWITDKPARGEIGTAAYAQSRRVICQGQGATPDEACADALAVLKAKPAEAK